MERRPELRLTKKNLADIARAEKDVKKLDLYHALHCVGDDTTKLEIEETLRALLDEALFKKVVAVFKVAVSDEV